MGEVLIGSEAIADGVVTRHTLQRWYRRIYPDIHLSKDGVPSLQDRTVGAWLWTRRAGIVTGIAASAIHGAEWVDDDVHVELIAPHNRVPAGLIVRDERIGDDEITRVAGLPVATPARTAFDLGRFLPRGQALERLDALMRARPFLLVEVTRLAERYRGARGVAKLKEVLPLVDGGAASPPETRLRLLYLDAGLPRPQTQIPILDECGHVIRTVDMGWEEFKVAAEYDGGQHQTDRAQYVKDLRVLPELARLGWKVMQVIKEDRKADVVARAIRAMHARGWDGTTAETAATQRKCG